MIRPFHDDDAAAVTALLRRLTLASVVSEAGLLHRRNGTPERGRYRSWVAVEDSDVVGWAEGLLSWEVSEEEVGFVWVAVQPEARDAAVRDILFDEAAAHVLREGARVLTAAAADEKWTQFLLARGFHERRREQISAVDPRGVDLSALPRLEGEKRGEGFRLVSLRAVRDRPSSLYALYMAAEADIPEEFREDNITPEEWRADIFSSPDLDHDGSFVALAGERPVSLAWLEVDRESRTASNDVTGTLPEFRRRGLARLVKLATIRWAAESGIERIVTANDEENTAMRVLNEQLGYRPIAVLRNFMLTTEGA